MTHKLDDQTAAHIHKTLRHLDHVPRNGPLYQASDILRSLVDLPPLKIGESPSAAPSVKHERAE